MTDKERAQIKRMLNMLTSEEKEEIRRTLGIMTDEEKAEIEQLLIECGHPSAPGEPLIEKFRNLCAIIDSYAELHRDDMARIQRYEKELQRVHALWDGDKSIIQILREKIRELEAKWQTCPKQ